MSRASPRTKFRGKLQRHAWSHGLLSCLRLSSFSLSFPRRAHTCTRVETRSISRSLAGRREHKGKKREYRRRSNGLRSGLPSFIFPTDPSLAIRSVPLLPALDPPSHACTRACECKKGEGVIGDLRFPLFSLSPR